MAAPPEARFVHGFAAGILQPPSEREDGSAADLFDALAETLGTEKSVVLEVQFTGFTRRGRPVGGVDPTLIRAAGHLIVQRVTLVGFTREARLQDLRTVVEILSGRAGAESGGVIAALREAGLRGIYVGTAGGEVYRPAADAPASPEPTPEAPSRGPDAVPAEIPGSREGGETAPSTDPSAPGETPEGEGPGRGAAVSPPADSPAAGPAGGEPEDSGAELRDFELIEEPDETPTPPGAASAPPAPELAGEEFSDDLYHFFRTSSASRGPRENEAERIGESLRTATSLNRYDELTNTSAGVVIRELEAENPEAAVRLMLVLVEESQRQDRSRVFRDSAAQALRRITTDAVLVRLGELLGLGEGFRRDLLRILTSVGGNGLATLEATIFRTGDADLREAIFRAMLHVDPMNQRILARAMEDPVGTRVRSVLELSRLPAVDSALTLRWCETALTHADPSIRSEALRGAAHVGGRGGVRILLELLSDPDPSLRRSAVESLGVLGDPAAVPFLSRALNEVSEEEVELAIVDALGRIGSPDALPVLSGVIGRRQLFGGKRLLRLKSTAVTAISRIGGPGASEILTTIASGKDRELAAIARDSLPSS